MDEKIDFVITWVDDNDFIHFTLPVFSSLSRKLYT